MTKQGGVTAPSGTLGLRVLKGTPPHGVWEPNPTLSIRQALRLGTPDPEQSAAVNEWRKANAPNLARGLAAVAGYKAVPKPLRRPTMFGALYLRILHGNGDITPLGLASLQVVTTAGVGFIVDAFQNLTELENMRFHAIGTGTNAEAVGDTALQTELTTQYNPDNTRATGTLAEAAANIFRTVGTNTVDASAAVTEHGILTQAATGGGVLLDRSVFAVINLVASDSLESTYDFTVTAGG